LVIVYVFSDMVLDFVCQYFIEDFYIRRCKGDWPVVFLFECVLVQFWDECNTGFIK
jgi:hypothetical protein